MDLPAKVQRSRGIKCKPDLVISPLKTLVWLPIALRGNGKPLSLVFKASLFGLLSSPASVPHTINLSSTWTLRVSMTSELSQVQFPCQASIKKFSPFVTLSKSNMRTLTKVELKEESG